jgi:hypothetical protein
MDRTLNQLMRELSEIATAHRQIKEYFQGDYLDAVSRDAAQYPLMVATLQPGGLGDGFVQVNIIITIADKYNLQEYRQINEIHSDCLSICNDIKITMQQYRWTEFSDINFTISTDPFIQRSQDMTAGWSMNVSLNVFDDGNWCDLPMDDYDFENGTPTHSNDCQPAVVSNSNGSFSREIPSGDTFTLDDVRIQVFNQNEELLSDAMYPAAIDEQITINIAPCEDASYRITTEADVTLYEGTIESGGSLLQPINDSLVHNTNDSYLVGLPAEGNLELPDVFFSINNTLGTQVLSSQVPSVTNQTLIAPDGAVHIKHEADGTIANVLTPSGVTTEYIIQNNDITVNGANGFIIHAEEPLDILLQNTSGGTIAAQSVTYNGNQDHVHIVINTASFVPVGAKLLKTGQTTSYATGDDGATQRGRSINFLTLASNNPFGTTARFTNKTGGSTYANSVAYDWSTYDGSTVLAYYFGDTNARTWSAQLTQHTASTFDGLTGWNLTNFVEMTNIMNFSLLAAFMLNYAPFSTNRRYFWISTSPSGSAGISTDLASVGCFASSNKANTNGGIWVRVCTVNGTTIS